LKCFENASAFAAIKSEPSGADLNELVAHLMSQGTPKMQQKLAAAHKNLSGEMLASAVLAARAIMKPADFYNEFRPLLMGMPEKKTKKTSAQADRGDGLLRVLRSDDDHSYYRRWGAIRDVSDRTVKPLPELDPRWLDAAVEAGSLELVCQLARPGHVAANDFLFAQFAKMKELHEAQRVLHVMVRVRHPKAGDAIIEALKKQAKATTHYYFSYWYGRMIADLPRSELPKFEELLPTLPDKMVDQLMDAVLALKNKPE
jgi:uncharacterized protein (DUF3820 family)